MWPRRKDTWIMGKFGPTAPADPADLVRVAIYEMSRSLAAWPFELDRLNRNRVFRRPLRVFPFFFLGSGVPGPDAVACIDLRRVDPGNFRILRERACKAGLRPAASSYSRGDPMETGQHVAGAALR